jgi:nitrogen-specific signal transduction histidine kinase
LHIFSVSKYDRRKFFVLVSVLLFVLLVDISISNVADIVSKEAVSFWGIVAFAIICVTYGIGQYFILEMLKRKIKESKIQSPQINSLSKMVTVVLYALTTIIVFAILQILMNSIYYTNLLSLAVAISYGLAVFVMGLLARRLLSWFRLSRNLVVLLYGLAAAMITINALDSIVFFDVVLLGKPSTITPQSKVIFDVGFSPGTVMDSVAKLQNVSNIAYFLLTWGGTILLLRHHIQRVGTIKFWILVSLPLIYFMSYYFTLYQTLTPSTPAPAGAGLTLSILLFTYATTLCGILFGLGFRSIAKTTINSDVRDYMLITAYGFILFFTTGNATVLQAGYPPFGVANVSFVGLSSFLILLGLYYSAISVAHDAKLRQSIKKSAIEESKLLVSIGSAQMMFELERRVLKTAADQEQVLTKRTGVQSSLTEHEMKEYLGTVLKDIKIVKDLDAILKKGKEILENSNEFLVCSRFGGIQLAYHNYFDVYQKKIDKFTKGEHKGIRLVTSISDTDSPSIVEKFLKIGVQIRHVKNMPPIDFAVSDKEMIATIEKTEAGEVIRNLLVSNERPYLDHFTSIFEELWKNGTDAKDRLRAIREGVDSEGIEIIQNPSEIHKIYFNLIKSAKEEVLIVFAAVDTFQHQDYAELFQLLNEATETEGVTIRILMPMNELNGKAVEIQRQPPRELRRGISVRYIRSDLQTKVSILVVDRKFSLIVELKDNTKYDFKESVGLAIYSNSKPTVLSYASIFQSLWLQTELYDQLKLHDKMQEEFINIAAHELRTPIQPLLMSSQSLSRTMPNEERVSIVIRNAKKLQLLANDILDVTRIESQTLKLMKEKVDMNDVLLNAVKDMTNQIPDRENLKLIYNLNQNIFVEADKGRIYQVIVNLLNNAVKFTEEGIISIDMEMKEDKKKEVVIRVRDSGAGIDPQIQPKLFSKFASKSFEGTGLGLFIAKSIVEAHGGTIWAKNNENEKGATFAFSLPMSP